MTENIEQRYCTKFYQKLGDIQAHTIRKIQRVFGDDAIEKLRARSRTTASNMFAPQWRASHGQVGYPEGQTINKKEQFHYNAHAHSAYII